MLNNSKPAKILTNRTQTFWWLLDDLSDYELLDHIDDLSNYLNFIINLQKKWHFNKYERKLSSQEIDYITIFFMKSSFR